MGQERLSGGPGLWHRYGYTAARVAGALIAAALAAQIAEPLGAKALIGDWIPLPTVSAIVAVAAVGIVIRRDLAVLLAFVVFVNVPFFVGTVWDVRDTTAAFEMFYAIYGELYHSNQLLLWLPYGTFGQPADYVTGFSCSGVDFLVLLLGRLLRVQNAWLLYCLARLGEQIVFLMGTFLLSRTLFRRRSTVFLVCLASSGGLAWYWHTFFGLRMIYVFPIALLFLVWFFEKRQPEFLWLSGLSCVFAGQGASYLMCIWLFVFLIISAIWPAVHREAWRNLLSRKGRNLALLGLFVALAGSFVYVNVASVQGFVFLKAGRDPGTGKVLLDDYLHHGGNLRLNRMGRDLLAGENDINDFDNNFYTGLLPLFFVAWGLARERSARFWAIACAAVALVWLSFGGVFASLTYYLPLMAYYRWLAWVLPLARVLIILAAGFGFERFWVDTNRWRLAFGITVLLLFTADAAGVPYSKVEPLLRLYAAGAALVVLLGRWASRASAGADRKVRVEAWARVVLVATLGVDILCYQLAVHQKLPRITLTDEAAREMFSVSRMEYQGQRTREPRTTRAGRVIRYTFIGYPVATHNFLQWDGCSLGGPVPDHLLMVPAGVHRLFLQREPDDPALLAIVGCETPKLRLVSRAVYAADDTQAGEYISRGDDVDGVVVLQLAPGVAPPTPESLLAPASGTIQVAAFTANRIDLVADVAGRSGAWLVYADGYHRGWHATVNGQRAPIAKANLAFKAVWVPAGRSAVRLVFWDGLASTLAYLLALWSIGVDLLLLAWLAKLMSDPHCGEYRAPHRLEG